MSGIRSIGLRPPSGLAPTAAPTPQSSSGPAYARGLPTGSLPNAPDTLTLSTAAPPLSPSLVSQLLQLQSASDDPTTTGSSADGAGGGGATLGAAAIAGGTSLAGLLTDSDKALIKAATGVDVSSVSALTDPSALDKVSPLVSQIVLDRANGTLIGDATPSYVQGLFTRLKAAGTPTDPNWLPNALLHLAMQGGTLPIASTSGGINLAA